MIHAASWYPRRAHVDRVPVIGHRSIARHGKAAVVAREVVPVLLIADSHGIWYFGGSRLQLPEVLVIGRLVGGALDVCNVTSVQQCIDGSLRILLVQRIDGGDTIRFAAI